MNLPSKAEQEADKSRELPNFRDFSLPGVREKVAETLSLIGREGIFSTYTVHNISHIGAMLDMLDWLIPESTRKSFTPVDWLLTVLSIYLHDLGLVVTTEEFENRKDNLEFNAWFGGLGSTSEGRDYLARTRRMNEGEKQRFFFQEYVRKGHGARIREWITGRHSRNWGREVRTLAKSVEELLKPLPSRFREHLATVCESHHEDNLHLLSIYPLAAGLGNHSLEIVNVQYAAVLLRSADLLHVTKDRTPSVMYQTIKFSDPKSVTEWDKQRGTFAVRAKKRKLIEDDPETAVIVMAADFTDESPFFALQEYVAYADRQIKQSKRWIDQSREDSDGEAYSFPWNRVEADIRLEGVSPVPLKFELDRGRLLDLLVGHTIYNDPLVAVRELLQNSIDAVRYQYYLDKRRQSADSSVGPAIGKVAVIWNSAERLLIVEDNGTGMNRDVIDNHLMRVGVSFYDSAEVLTVDYIEDVKPPIRIGFESVGAAVEHFFGFHTTSLNNESQPEVIVKKSLETTEFEGVPIKAQYELGFVVRRGWQPERVFARAPDGPFPMVCIEGIRVSDHLPGFESLTQRRRLATLLSVRGSRQFRTTVSRSGLEQDDEYKRVARIGAKLLFEHVRDEVARIVDLAGTPLSQASSASRWLRKQILDGARGDTWRYIWTLYNEIPSVVIETVSETPNGFRSLASNQELSKLPVFWTLDARLVDFLGTISRDIGRELSLNEFVSNLAPDLKHFRFSPLIPDAGIFDFDFWDSHHPVSVEMSRERQYSAIQWVLGPDHPNQLTIDLLRTCSRDFFDAASHVYGNYHYDLKMEDSNLATIAFFAAPIEGDSEKIDVVATKVGIVVSPDSRAHRFWKRLKHEIDSVSKVGLNPDRLAELYLFAAAFRFLIRNRLANPRGLNRWAHVWAATSDETRAQLELPRIPTDMVTPEAIFSARTYWRDWETISE